MSYGFVAYFDESGEDGLKRVRPIHPDGSSEWFIISAVVVQASNEKMIGRIRRDIRSKFHNAQRKDIHYIHLSAARKVISCQEIGAAPLRCFAVMSNKKNMIGYHNPRCYEEKNYLYWWLTRLLLERVTKFCKRKSARLYREDRSVKMIFSQRGGMSYERLIAYLNLLRFQTQTDSVYLKAGNLAWDVVDLNQILVQSHKNEAGLQLADVVAGALYEAVSMDSKNPCNTEYAELLLPRIYRGNGAKYLQHGIKVMPQLWRMGLLPPQQALFEKLGFQFEKAVGARPL